MDLTTRANTSYYYHGEKLVAMKKYQAVVDVDYDTVSSSLGSGQMVGWSSDLGYHAVDIGSYYYDDWWY